MSRQLRALALDGHLAVCGRGYWTGTAQTPNPNGNYNVILNCDCGWFYWDAR